MAKWNRRQILSGLLVAAGAEATALPGDVFALQQEPVPARPQAAGASRSGTPSVEHREVPSAFPGRAAPHAADGTPHALQQMLPPGLRFGRWRVVEVLAVKFGAVPVILETRGGSRFQVDVLRRDRQGRAKRGVAETQGYALYLANLGRGMKPTREEHGLGLLWLAALMRPREHRYARPALLTLRERLERFPGGRFDALASAAEPTTEPAREPTDPRV